jgi:hypothetical protein
VIEFLPSVAGLDRNFFCCAALRAYSFIQTPNALFKIWRETAKRRDIEKNGGKLQTGGILKMAGNCNKGGILKNGGNCKKAGY